MTKLFILLLFPLLAACQTIREGDFAEYHPPILPTTKATIVEDTPSNIRRKCSELGLTGLFRLTGCASWWVTEDGRIEDCVIYMPNNLSPRVKEKFIKHEMGHCQEGKWHGE